MIWTDEADDILIRLWDETGSLDAIAIGLNEAGFAVTKNSVSGRRHRLPREAFKRDISAYAAEIARPKPAAPWRSHQKKVTPMTDQPKKPPPTPTVPFHEHQGIDYLDLQSWGCKAIMDRRSEDGWRLHKVCGRLRLEGSPYCRDHLRLYTSTDRRGVA
jgi:hypothetical protein